VNHQFYSPPRLTSVDVPGGGSAVGRVVVDQHLQLFPENGRRPQTLWQLQGLLSPGEIHVVYSRLLVSLPFRIGITVVPNTSGTLIVFFVYNFNCNLLLQIDIYNNKFLNDIKLQKETEIMC